jgi:quinol monooxygenase YgiN
MRESCIDASVLVMNAIHATPQHPLVARTWTGRTRAHDADAYLAYLYEEGVRPIESRPGCLGMQLFRRLDGDVAEFTTISYWRDFDAMAAMHPQGADDIRRVAHLPRDPEFLLELPEYAEIAELHANDWS